MHFYVYPVIRKVSINLSFAIADLSFFSGTLSFLRWNPEFFFVTQLEFFPMPKLGNMGKIMSILRSVGTFYDLLPTIFQWLATITGNGVAGKLHKPEFLSKIPEFFGKPEFFSDLSFFENAQKKPGVCASLKLSTLQQSAHFSGLKPHHFCLICEGGREGVFIYYQTKNLRCCDKTFE